MIEGIPEGWTAAELGQILEFKYGKGLTQENRAGQGNVGVYGSNGIVGYHTSGITNGPTLIIGRKGSVGEVHYSDSACWPIDTTYFVDEIPGGMEIKFWLHYLRFLRLGQNDKSSAIPGISRGDIVSIEVAIPPSGEQRRIVAKLEALLAKVDASRKRLERIPTILKRFRQAVLAAACDGRLTEDWRIERHQDEVGDEGLPEGWCQVNVGNLLEGLKYGTAAKCEYDQKGFAVLRIPNVSEGRIDTTDLKFAELSAKEIAALSLAVGDILMIRSNGSVSLVGRTALVEEGHQGLAYAGYLIRLRPNKESVDPRFLNRALSSFKVRLKIELEARSTSGVNNINSEEVRELEILLPPLAEQAEIVHRVNDLFALAEQIEARYTKAKTQVDRLTQSILAKAFRGELVPQDPNDEPADALLSRLTATPSEAPTPARRRGRPPRVQPAAPPVAPAAPAEDCDTHAQADLTTEAILQAHREVLASIPSPLSEDNLLRAVALRLGFRRLGGRIKARIKESLPS